MKKIQTPTIVLIACLSLTFIFYALIPIWLGISIGVLSIVMLALLNVGMFKVEEVIKKLIIYIDATLGLFLILTFIPNEIIGYKVNHYLSYFLVLVFAGLLILILVNAYRIEKKKSKNHGK
jgi:pilus assembly protein TadC